MRNKSTRLLRSFLLFLGLIVLFFLIFQIFAPRPKKYKEVDIKPQKIVYTAIGDSITHGVGDTNENQGFVGALKDRFEELEIQTKVNNYGYTGETSAQIRKRLKTNYKLKKAIAKADFITFEMGGNDMIYTIQNNFFKLRKEEFKPRAKNYQKNLKWSLREIRKINPRAKIIVLGIYNPFSLYFSEIKDLDELFKEWNNITNETSKEIYGCYFEDIDHLINGKKAKKMVDGKIVNRYLSSKDSVHPNGQGYSIIANDLFKLINKYKILR